MDTSDDGRLILLFILKKRKQIRKKKRSIWCREHFVLRATCGEYIRPFRSLLDNRDEALFFNYTRMTYDTYKELMELVLPLLQPVGANWRQPITGEEKLILTLRHLATGGSFASMSVPFHMSRTSISRHVMATCQVIWDVLRPLELPTPTAEQWRMTAKRFGDLWDYPFAIGALDGKHIVLQNPANSGSMYYNYKGYPNVVLMALSDADSCFSLVDCGQYGRISDAGVYNISRISTLLDEKQLDIPTATFKISGSDIDIPFMIIGDEAFPLKPYLMKRFAARTLNTKRRLHNYRHSRARRAVECAFGIMSRKFEVFQRPMRVQPDKAVLLTNAAVCLHNFIRRRDGHLVDSSSTVTYEVKENRGDGMQPLAINARGGRSTDEAIAIRDGIADFFSVPDGSVHWQNKLVFRHVLRTDDE